MKQSSYEEIMHVMQRTSVPVQRSWLPLYMGLLSLGERFQDSNICPVNFVAMFPCVLSSSRAGGIFILHSCLMLWYLKFIWK